jgi:hypothetical protein
VNKFLQRIGFASLERGEILKWMVLVGSAAAIAAGLYLSSWISMDWEFYRLAALNLLHGSSPYQDPLYLNPPWILIPLIPLALLPAKLGSALAATAGFFVYILIARHFKASKPALVIFLLSPPVLYDLYAANINWLTLSGILMPPWLGLFFVTAKPQVGVGIAIYWLIQAWQQGGWRQVVKTFTPITVVFLVTLPVFGLWFRQSRIMLQAPYNMSLWPYGILAGVVLLVFAIRLKRMNYAVAASPLLSPYFTFHTWGNILIGLLPNPWLLLLADLILVVFYAWLR